MNHRSNQKMSAAWWAYATAALFAAGIFIVGSLAAFTDVDKTVSMLIGAIPVLISVLTFNKVRGILSAPPRPLNGRR